MTTRDKKDDRAKTNSMFCLSAVFLGGVFFVFFFLPNGRCLERESVYFYERLE